jgi:hypothetical protein
MFGKRFPIYHLFVSLITEQSEKNLERLFILLNITLSK